ncbi:MAG: hypothetical protein WCK36_00945 [Candidatus Firestonebacteria bacterium]
MKSYILLLLALFPVCLFADDYVNPVVKQEIEEMLSKDQITTGKLLIRVNKLIVVEQEEKNPVPAVSELDRRSGFLIFKKSFMEPVYYNTKPSQAELNPASFEYFCAPGHFGNITIGLVPLETGEVRVDITDLKNEKGDIFKKENIDIRHVKHLLKKTSLGVCKVMPEMIIKGNPIKTYKDVTRLVWLMPYVPEGTKPGNYQGIITLKMGDKEKREVGLKIEVLPFKLLTDPGKSFGWFCSPVDETGLKDYKNHEFNSIASGFECTVLSLSGGKPVLDFSKMDKTAAILKKLKLGECRNIAAVINVYQDLNRLGLKDFTPEFNAAYKNTLEQMRDQAEKLNIKIVFWLVDEPRESLLAAFNKNFADTLKLARLAKEVKEIEIYQDIMQDSQFTDALISEFVATFDIMSPHCALKYCPKIIAETKKQKKQLWFYNSSVGRFGFTTWKHGAVGRTEWAYNCGLSETTVKNIDTWTTTRPGDPACSVVYPTAKEVIPSPTFEWASQGIVDYRYIYTLEQAIEKAKKGTAEAKTAATRAAEKLENIKKLVPEYADTVSGYLPGIEDTWRREIADETAKLQKITE